MPDSISERSVRYFTVSEAEAGQKLLACLKRRLGSDLPDALLHRIIRGGEVRVNGSRAQAFARLAAGDEVRVPPLRLDRTAQTAGGTVAPEEAGAAARNAPAEMLTAAGLYIVAETPEYLVINKPAGLAAQPGSKQADSVSAILAVAFAGVEFTPTPAHRLDKATSGLILVGKTYRALRAAQEALREHSLGKDYLAWVEGDWPCSGPVDLYDLLEKQDTGGGREKVMTGAGKAALCTARPLLSRAGRTLLLIRLRTGRTHQIRVQLASRGHPIVGDAKYGGPGRNQAGRPPAQTGGQNMCLHAWRLILPYGQVFAAPPPWRGEFAVGSEILAAIA